MTAKIHVLSIAFAFLGVLGLVLIYHAAGDSSRGWAMFQLAMAFVCGSLCLMWFYVVYLI